MGSASVVEVDETFVGGKAKNGHKDKHGDGSGGTGGMGKAVVAGAVQRKGNVVARVISNVRAETLTGFIRESVSNKVSLLVTDHWVGYKHLADEFPQHAVINHAAGQYVIGAIHTNTMKAFGASSSAALSEPSTKSAKNTSRSTPRNSNSATTTARTRISLEKRLGDADFMA